MKKTVLITGCSSGVGLEAAAAFARAGDIVYASMRDLSKSEELDALLAKQGAEARNIELDVTRPETFEDCVAQIVSDTGRLDVLVNNAGVLPVGAFEDVSEEELRNVMEVNFFGPALLTKAVLPTMRRQKDGCVIMVSSLSGMASKGGDAAYAASKFALEGLTEGMRNEIARWNIRTALVEPGQYATGIFRSIYEGGVADTPYRSLNEHLRAELTGGASAGMPPRALGELLVTISRSDETRLRWPADDTAKHVMKSVFAQDDQQRGAFLRGVGGFEWWIEGRDAPDA